MSLVNIYLTKNIRIYAGDLTNVAKEAISVQEPTPLASLVLSTAISTFGTYASLKEKTDLHIIYKVSGVIKTIVVDIKANGDLKALVGNKFITTDFDDKDVNSIPIKVGLGETGILYITNINNGKRFGSQVKMAKGDIVTDLAWYLDQSDQIKSVVITDVFFKEKELERANTIIVQMLPEHTEEDILFVENIVKNNKLSELGLEEYIKLFGAKKIGSKEINWKAEFTLDKAKKVLSTIDKEEQLELIKENGFIEIKDEFSNTSYKFDKVI